MNTLTTGGFQASLSRRKRSISGKRCLLLLRVPQNGNITCKLNYKGGSTHPPTSPSKTKVQNKYRNTHDRHIFAMPRTSQASLWMISLIALTAHEGVEAFEFATSSNQRSLHSGGQVRTAFSTERRKRARSSSLHMYLPPDTATSKTAPMVSRSILSVPHHTGKNRNSPRLPMSHSVLASSDTLPSFQMAHGLLSPEIVQRMDDMTTMRNERKTAEVTKFLDTYHQEGPMACLDMLSDPCILPKLTEAMRDIA